MAQYKTHSLFNLFFALPICIGGYYYFFHPSTPLLATFFATFVYGTLFMNPDLDLAHKIKVFSLRGILSLPFRSYSALFSHRGISHAPIIGTLTRLGWLFLFYFAGFYLLTYSHG